MATVHAVFDSATQRLHATLAAQERQQEILARGIMSQADYSRAVQESDMHDLERQSGRRYVTTLFESMLLGLAPDRLRVRLLPLDPADAKRLLVPEGASVRCLDRTYPNGTFDCLTRYRNEPFLPEFTIILMGEKVVPNPYVRQAKASDFPKHEKGPDGKPVFDGPTPLEMVVPDVKGTIPGWRSIVLRCVLEGIITATQAETTFGSADNAAWQHKLGKAKHTGLLT